MKKFSYQLQQVLNVRLLQRDQAEGALAIANNKLQQEIKKAEAIQSNIDRQLELSTDLNGRHSSSYFIQVQQYLGKLRQDLKSQQGQVKAAEIELDRCYKALFEARKKVSQLERHKDKQFEHWKEELTREDIKFADEVGSILNQRREAQEEEGAS